MRKQAASELLRDLDGQLSTVKKLSEPGIESFKQAAAERLSGGIWELTNLERHLGAMTAHLEAVAAKASSLAGGTKGGGGAHVLDTAASEANDTGEEEIICGASKGGGGAFYDKLTTFIANGGALMSPNGYDVVAGGCTISMQGGTATLTGQTVNVKGGTVNIEGGTVNINT